MADKMVATYRVLHDGMKVGDEVRNYGDLIPEAKDWVNIAVYLRNDYIEKVIIPQSELDKFIASRKKKVSPQKSTVKKTASKKTVAKKRLVVKKKKEQDNGRLVEQAV